MRLPAPSCMSSRWPSSPELLQEAQVVLVEHPQVRHAVLEEGDPLDPHAEREALDAVGVVPVLAHVAEHVRVHHPRAEDLDPAGPLAQRAARAVLHEALPAVEARDVDLDARLGEREEVRPQPHRPLFAEDRAGEAQQRALEVGERDVLVDREALDLVELRRVRRVVVAPVGAAGDDDVDRRGLQLHRAHLHRRGVRAQHDVVGQVERVRLEPRRVVLGEVEGVEVVVDEVGLRAFGDAEAEAEEDILDLAPDGGDHVVVAGGRERGAGQGDVDDVFGEPGLQLGRLELRLARLDGGLDRLARLVGAFADRAALLRRQLADVAQQVRQLRLAAEEAHPHLFQLGGPGGGGDRGFPFGSQRGDAVGGAHGRVILFRSSYRATVAAMAALRESAWAIGMCATSSHAATTASGRPSRSAPTTSVPASWSSRSATPARATSATRRPGSSLTSLTRATGTENSAPIEARTALWPNGSALPGPSATEPAPNASAPRMTVPTLPGSLTPHNAMQRAFGVAQRCG